MTNRTEVAGVTPPALSKKIARAVTMIVAVVALVVAGKSIWQQLQPKHFLSLAPSAFMFVEHAQSNCPLDGCDMRNLEFVGVDGRAADLKHFLGQKNVVLVVTLGNCESGGTNFAYYHNISLHCAAHTSRLIADYEAFRGEQAEVVVVLPIKQLADRGAMGEFQEAVRRTGATIEAPFPLVLDVELRTVDQLGLRTDLSLPATYILDKLGQVRFAYVGSTIADRPSVGSMLEQLAMINADAQ